MRTGEFYSSIIPPEWEFDAIGDAADYANKHLIHSAGIQIRDLFDKYQGKEIVILAEKVDMPPAASGTEYRMRLTILLLSWQDAEIGDCVHATGFNVSLARRLADAGVNKSFVWEGKRWRRIE